MPTRRIVVADDNRDAADALSDLLQTMGYEADVAYDGAQALELCRAAHPSLAILDVEMPGLDGCTAAERMRDLPDPPACIASFSGASLDQEPWASRCGVFDVRLSKPLDVGELEALLARAGNGPLN